VERRDGRAEQEQRGERLRSRSSKASGRGAGAARGEPQEQWKGARTAEEKPEQRESSDRSNGRGRTRGLLGRLVQSPRPVTSERDGRLRPIISVFI
jgi:hypothetical protein